MMTARDGLALRGVMLHGRLDAVDLVLRRGEVTAIVGPNGAGKSTLLSILAGALAPDAGAVMLEGERLSALDPRDRACVVGYLPQDGAVAWDISVKTLARLGRLPHRTGPAVDAETVAEALAALDLAALADRPVSRLSGGERSRALLARVLAGRPRWVLADEPLASLDLAHQRALMDRFRALAAGGQGRERAQGTGVVLVLHDLALAMNYADRVVVVDRGRVVADGAPRCSLTAQLIGDVWRVEAEWLGEPGHFALAISGTSISGAL